MSSLVSLPPLTDFGAPSKFSTWRRNQDIAVLRAIDSPKRFIVMCLPTGFGKSPLALGVSSLTNKRSIYLTATRALQSQLMGDFEPMGLVDIKGTDNYECVEYEGFGFGKPIPVSQGACHFGATCPKREGGCSYYDALTEAKLSKLVVTNYAYWMTQNAYGDGLSRKHQGEVLNPPQILILDEVAEAPELLAGFLAIEIGQHEIEGMLAGSLPRADAGVKAWKRWAAPHVNRIGQIIEHLTLSIKSALAMRDHTSVHQLGKHLRKHKQLEKKLQALSNIEGQWVAERTGQTMRFDPVWPQPYGERCLFRGVEKIILMSATVRPKTAELLGIGPDEFEFVEYPSTFDPRRRPVIHVPTVRMNHRTSDDEIGLWLARIDQIIGSRLDRKGIIHTVSYRRRDMILNQSRYSKYMLSHNSSTTRSVVERFKSMPPPAILVSPSVDTGYDFPDSQCRYQIIGKLPWPDTRSKVMQARSKDDPTYQAYVTMQTLVQMCGRAVRSEEDWAESLIIDDNVKWALFRYKEFVPQWFLDAVRFERTIPEPLTGR